MNEIQYSGTSIIRTSLGPHQTVLIIEVSLVRSLAHKCYFTWWTSSNIQHTSKILVLKLIFVYNNVYTIITIPVGYHISSRYIIVYNNGKQRFVLLFYCNCYSVRHFKNCEPASMTIQISFCNIHVAGWPSIYMTHVDWTAMWDMAFCPLYRI